MRTTPNRKMCVRGEAAWVREAWLLNARAERTKFSFSSAAGFGLVFDYIYTHFISFLALLFCLPLAPLWPRALGGRLGPWGA